MSSNMRLDRRRVDRLALGPHDLLGRRRLRALVGVEQVLVELLARRGAPTSSIAMSTSGRRPDSSIMSGAAARSRRARPSRARRPRRPAPATPARMIELDGLGDRHEVARHALVGDGHRAAERDLATEDRDDRARRAEDVAEAHGRVASSRASAAARPRPRTRPAPSTRPSPSPARPPCRSRPGRSAPTPSSPATRAHQPRRERVVAHGLDRVELHQPDVLVRRGVEDDGRAVLGEDLAHPLALLAVGEDGGEHRGMDVAVVLELALDAEEVVLGVVDEDQPPRRDTRDLAAELPSRSSRRRR